MRSQNEIGDRADVRVPREEVEGVGSPGTAQPSLASMCSSCFGAKATMPRQHVRASSVSTPGAVDTLMWSPSWHDAARAPVVPSPPSCLHSAVPIITDGRALCGTLPLRCRCSAQLMMSAPLLASIRHCDSMRKSLVASRKKYPPRDGSIVPMSLPPSVWTMKSASMDATHLVWPCLSPSLMISRISRTHVCDTSLPLGKLTTSSSFWLLSPPMTSALPEPPAWKGAMGNVHGRSTWFRNFPLIAGGWKSRMSDLGQAHSPVSCLYLSG
mmetsp:Transcript_3477/g.9062  ORF Transcript_3477/g.9062 Transcript_3477/m.9062 type:complete len:269 (-) Transcript_3477:508-1314(-)